MQNINGRDTHSRGGILHTLIRGMGIMMVDQGHCAFGQVVLGDERVWRRREDVDESVPDSDDLKAGRRTRRCGRVGHEGER